MTTARLILYHYVSGLVMLLANIIHNPEQETARDDMELVEPLLRLLNMLAEETRTEDIYRIRKFCVELERRTRIALGKVHSNDIAGPKRKRVFDSMTSQDPGPDRAVLRLLDSNLETTPSLVETRRAYDVSPTKRTRPDASLVADTTNTMDWTERFPELHTPAVGPRLDGYNLDDLDKFMTTTADDSNRPSTIGIVPDESDFTYLLSEWDWQGPFDGIGETDNLTWNENMSAPLQGSGEILPS